MEGSLSLFNMKNERERDQMSKSLREKIAYKSVLDVIGGLNDRNPQHSDLYGRYGPETSRIDLIPLIEAELHMMTPQSKRKMKAQELLQQRRRLRVFDRSLSTEALLRIRIKSRLSEERPKSPIATTGDRSSRKRGKLILPPLQVGKTPPSTAGDKVKTSTPQKEIEGEVLFKPHEENSDARSVPVVFLTQAHKEFTR